MRNKKHIEESLKSLILDESREFAAMLSGEWGIGKTYFWEKFQEEHLFNIKKTNYFKKITNCIFQNKINNLKNTVYISLFGYTSKDIGLQGNYTSIILQRLNSVH